MSTTLRTQPGAGHAQQEASAQVLLGRYRVLETNTQGGFGHVCVCWDSRLERRVAIKCMPLTSDPTQAAAASTINEALAEARTASMLAHPNIITMFDFECDGYYSYLVMEYVDGLNLQELLSRVEDGVLTFDECAHVLASVAAALDHAHVNGVLHLDIKPANILIDRMGIVKLTDFGMASLASAAGFGGARGGTVGYMPPEQIRGEVVDERTDIFALAVVVWHALTGRCPFAAATPEESERLIAKRPSPALSRIEPELAGTVEDTLLRALEVDPKLRMASVKSFADDLVGALGNRREGRESLADLLQQTEEDAEPSVEKDWERLRVPLTARHPWLPGAFRRLLAAALAAWAAAQTLPLVFPASTAALCFGVIGVALATASWPPLSGAFFVVALVCAIVTQTSPYSVVLALAFGAIGLVWWAIAGRRSDLTGPALILPACLNSPYAGMGLAGYALPAGSAFLTGVVGWVMWLVFRHAMDVGFAPVPLVESLSGVVREPRCWVLALSCGVAAMLASLIGRRRTAGAVVAGQACGIACVVGALALMAQMEKTSIESALDFPSLAVALTLSTTLCIAHALVGEDVLFREGDDIA